MYGNLALRSTKSLLHPNSHAHASRPCCIITGFPKPCLPRDVIPPSPPPHPQITPSYPRHAFLRDQATPPIARQGFQRRFASYPFARTFCTIPAPQLLRQLCTQAACDNGDFADSPSLVTSGSDLACCVCSGDMIRVASGEVWRCVYRYMGRAHKVLRSSSHISSS